MYKKRPDVGFQSIVWQNSNFAMEQRGANPTVTILQHEREKNGHGSSSSIIRKKRVAVKFNEAFNASFV